jgi:hypothetical protein
VRSIAKSRLPDVDELQVRVMHEPGRVQRPVRVLAPESLVREAAQLRVHQRYQAIESLLIPLTPFTKQRRDVRRVEGHDPDSDENG